MYSRRRPPPRGAVFFFVSPPPSCGRGQHISHLLPQVGAGENLLRKVQALLRPGTGGRLCSPNLRIWNPVLSIELHPYIYRPQRRYAPGWVRLSGGLFVVLTKALRPRLHRRCFVLPGRLLLFTACFAAWKVRPSGPDRGLHRAAAYKMEPFLPGVPCGILHPAPIAERSIFLEGSPPAGTHKRGNLLSVLYLTR